MKLRAKVSAYRNTWEYICDDINSQIFVTEKVMNEVVLSIVFAFIRSQLIGNATHERSDRLLALSNLRIEIYNRIFLLVGDVSVTCCNR